jgi:hypothetical protein
MKLPPALARLDYGGRRYFALAKAWADFSSASMR